jgi:hypothetical protein
MSDNDALDRAVRALRETGEASAADVARTRMRIMETMHRGERRGRRTFWVLLPIAAVLAGSTALAKNSDVVRRAWTGVAEAVGIVEPAEKAAPVRPMAAPAENAAGAENPAPAESATPLDSPAAPQSAAHENGAPSPNTALADKAAAPAAPRHPRKSPPVDPAAATELPQAPPETAPAESPSAAAVDDGEAASLSLYKQAYRLHFVEQRYAAALVAWDDYLRAAPAGRLVVEARYNRGIALVRLGRRVEAETALAPFARGEVSGGYRAREARELLDALNGSSR